jgi:hypothetical protein
LICEYLFNTLVASSKIYKNIKTYELAIRDFYAFCRESSDHICPSADSGERLNVSLGHQNVRSYLALPGQSLSKNHTYSMTLVKDKPDIIAYYVAVITIRYYK